MKKLLEIPKLKQLLDECKKTPQNPIYHGEGDVYTHTIMVSNEYEKIKSKLNTKEQFILETAIILHDIGKTKCTRVEDNEIVSYGHSKISYHITLELLDELNIPFEIKKEIAILILYHGKPIWLHEKTEMEQEYEIIKMSSDCSLKLLYYLVMCDFKGRIASDINDKIDNIEYFKLQAIELDCFDKPFDFKSNIAKYNYMVKRTHHYLDNPFNNTKSKVYMMSGLPGVGKDYYIKHNLKELNVISLDDIRKKLKIKATDNQGHVIQHAKDLMKTYLRKGTDFVINSTNTSKLIRNSYINILNDYNAYITIIYIDKKMKTILYQNKNREDEIPEKVINKLFRNIDIPLNCEVHSMKYITK